MRFVRRIGASPVKPCDGSVSLLGRKGEEGKEHRLWARKIDRDQPAALTATKRTGGTIKRSGGQTNVTGVSPASWVSNRQLPPLSPRSCWVRGSACASRNIVPQILKAARTK